MKTLKKLFTLTCFLLLLLTKAYALIPADIFTNYTVTADGELSPMSQHLAFAMSTEKIYPNPASDRLYIRGIGNKASLALIDAWGRLVLQQPVDAGSSVAIGQLTPGVYWAQITVNGKLVYQQKIVKQ
ncbi:T9SS type A sorting domain-containing protein [Taibaiella koreensis]|uniref:T9SS type A sorting domain-containing protein n=1 Tax=Taibaiella koreensis TaxID=1268548 RepID=UPI000E59A196|nr:T9SS type A sorting domain-containing protein [Taibaiella koreensis]